MQHIQGKFKIDHDCNQAKNKFTATHLLSQLNQQVIHTVFIFMASGIRDYENQLLCWEDTVHPNL